MSKVNFADIKQHMSGREIGFLRYMGLSDYQLSGKHQACEGCGGGKDRYRTIKESNDGSYFCSEGGGGTGGDWIAHLIHVKSMTASEVFRLAKDYLGLDSMEEWDKDKARKSRLDMAEKARAKEDAAYFDYHTEIEMDELILMIKYRSAHGGEIGAEEFKQARKVMSMLDKRYVSKTAKRPPRPKKLPSNVSKEMNEAFLRAAEQESAKATSRMEEFTKAQEAA